MNVASRTPGGWPGRCSVCGYRLQMEPSLPSGDATCPACGSLVWLAVPMKVARHTASPRSVGLKVAFAAALLAWLLYLGVRWTGLGGYEVGVLVVLAILLLGRRLPSLVRMVFGRSASGR